MSMADKAGGFGSVPGDLFDNLTQLFDPASALPAALEPRRVETLMQLAKTEHAAANATKEPYVVDVAFKCGAIQSEYLIAKNGNLADPVRDQAMANIVAILKSLHGLWK
jgi:hypothetical protein